MTDTPTTTARRRYAVAGTGLRAGPYIRAILGEHADVADLVAWCEPNPTRAGFYDEPGTGASAHQHSSTPLPRYTPDQLETTIAEQRVDVVIVTAPDHTHADLVARALAAGADAVVEKPLTVATGPCTPGSRWTWPTSRWARRCDRVRPRAAGVGDHPPRTVLTGRAAGRLPVGSAVHHVRPGGGPDHQLRLELHVPGR